MLVFLLKKTFFEMWDNLLSFILINTGMVILVSLIILVPSVIQMQDIILIFYFVIGLLIINFYIGAIYRYTMDISDYKTVGIQVFFMYFIRSWKESIVSFLIMIIVFAILLYAIPYYFLSGSLLDTIFGTIVSWVWLTLFISGFYFFPACFRLKQKILKTIQTCFAFLFENIAFSCFMLVVFIILLPISLFLLFLFPGPATIILWINTCFKIRLYKYDYLRENAKADRKEIPWDELIRKDKEKVGNRSIKGMIFPWKA